MPPVTRSQARKLVDDLRTTPYTSRALARLKKFEQASDLIRMLDREKTPEPLEIMQEFCQVATFASEKLSQNSGLHLMGDILFNATVAVRKYIRDNTSPKQDTTAFIKAWIERAKDRSTDDDTTPQADLLRRFVAEKEAKKCPNPKSQIEAYRKYKTWLVMYYERCELVHSALQDKSDQEIWNFLKKAEQDIKKEKVTFSNPDWSGYSLAAIQDVKDFKFIIADGTVTTKAKIPIAP